MGQDQSEDCGESGLSGDQWNFKRQGLMVWLWFEISNEEDVLLGGDMCKCE